jgi:hypothetical protein
LVCTFEQGEGQRSRGGGVRINVRERIVGEEIGENRNTYNVDIEEEGEVVRKGHHIEDGGKMAMEEGNQ